MRSVKKKWRVAGRRAFSKYRHQIYTANMNTDGDRCSRFSAQTDTLPPVGTCKDGH
jgi:hypothetical protein